MWNICWRDSETIYRSCILGVVEDNKVFGYEIHCAWSADDRVETWGIRWTNKSEHDIHIWSRVLWSIDDQSIETVSLQCEMKYSWAAAVCSNESQNTKFQDLVVTSLCGGKYLLAVCTNNEYSIRSYRMGISCFRIEVNNALSFTVCDR